MDEELKPESEADAKPSGMSFLRSNGLIIGLLLISLFLNVVPGLRLILLPFEFFTTFIHEGSHAIASLIMGEQVHRIVINPDTSGYMQHTVTGGMFAQGFIGSAGYVGAALFGGLLIVLSSFEKMSKFILGLLGLVFLAAIVLYIRDLFTLAVCGFLSASLLLIAWKGGKYLNFFAINFLAVQCSLNSFGDVITLLQLSMGAPKSQFSTGLSDAEALAKVFLLPAMFWSVLWIVISIVVLYKALKISGRIRMKNESVKP
ncbi:M50 family metallopeptidase [bacterium]|nr:M50 family metallopeptidase [bacterium]